MPVRGNLPLHGAIMNTTAESPALSSTAKSISAKSWAQRIAGVAILSMLLVVVLWITAFSFVTSLLIGSGVVVVVVAACTVSDVIAMILDAVATAMLLVLEVVAAAVAAIFGLFGF